LLLALVLLTNVASSQEEDTMYGRLVRAEPRFTGGRLFRIPRRTPGNNETTSSSSENPAAFSTLVSACSSSRGVPAHRDFSTYGRKGERMRIAVVGGGASGLSSALHLAPLVEQGLICGPIDVFTDNRTNARDIGVGIWSTALDPFRESDRKSHQLVYDSMTQTHGTWLGDVGYRTPNGAWLMKSHLPTNEQEQRDGNMPGLLFLRERDMVNSLQKAVHWEEIHHGTIQVHSHSARVAGLYEESSKPWSTNLLLQKQKSEKTNDTTESTNENQSPITLSERDYHLIVAGDGMNSVLRRIYGGHDSVSRRLTGTSALPSPIEIPNNPSEDYNSAAWNKSQHRQAVGIQDRNYTVFRGNSPLTHKEMKEDDVSFQTWGTGKSMRFATVPMMCPSKGQGREEKQVWFITIDDDAIANEPDPEKQRDMLLHEFRDWHDPIAQIVSATPPGEILVERALAHRHSMGPVLNFNTNVVKHLRGKRPPSSGEGPCITFIGDAYMTVDPILAQGFTTAMEGAASLRNSIERSCAVSNDNQSSSSSPGSKTTATAQDEELAFDPYQMRKELRLRQQRRMDRIICLLRATELVQALGQPSGSTTITGLLNIRLLRPLTKLTPNFIKAPIFDAVLKYSLGLGLFSSAVDSGAKRQAELDKAKSVKGG